MLATVSVLVLADLLGAITATLFAVSIAPWAGHEIGGRQAATLVGVVGLIPLAFAFLGLYPGIGVSRVSELWRATLAVSGVFLAALPLVVVFFGVAHALFWMLAWTSTVVMVPVTRAIVRDVAAAKAPWWGVPVVILGAGRAGSGLLERLQVQPGSVLRPVAAFDDAPELLGTEVHGVPVAGTLADASSYADEGVRHAIVAMPSVDSGRLGEVVREHASRFRSVFVLPDVGEGGRDDGAGYDREHLVDITDRRHAVHRRRDLIVKRALDVTLLVPSSLVAVPVVALSALIVAIVSPGNPFYAQERIGLRGARFKMWKLRTMYLDAEERLERHLAENPEARTEWETRYKLTRDTRILPGVGTFLRVSSLDELPQLLNIALGQMSFVGPRPFPAYHLAAFDEEFQELRTRVAPGLTGLWQIKARSASDLNVQKELDSTYIVNWSVWMDVSILVRTPLAVVKGKGAE